jgi:hypothetical protein
MPKRTLALRREALTDLTPAELVGVVAADQESGFATCPVVRCVERTLVLCITGRTCL